MRSHWVGVWIVGLLLSASANAGEAEIVMAEFTEQGNGWDVSVTLRHGDSGWDHYADAWRVVGEDGAVIGTRTLFHPHENEQPFTRGLGGVRIPAGQHTVYVEAHDKVHGWSGQRVKVDISKDVGERFRVRR